MDELTLRLERIRRSELSPNGRQSPVYFSPRPSYINEPLALVDDTSDDDDYVKPTREIPVDHVHNDEGQDQEK